MIFACRSGCTVNFDSTSSIRSSRVLPQDIALGLSRIFRFCGQTIQPYTVAQHSLLVAELMRRRYQSYRAALAGLLHDAHEAFTSDIPKPAKDFLERAGTGLRGEWKTPVSTMEQALDDMIRSSLGVEHLEVSWEGLKQCDDQARAIEMNVMIHGKTEELLGGAFTPEKAEREFLNALDSLRRLALHETLASITPGSIAIFLSGAGGSGGIEVGCGPNPNTGTVYGIPIEQIAEVKRELRALTDNSDFFLGFKELLASRRRLGQEVKDVYCALNEARALAKESSDKARDIQAAIKNLSTL